jgi:hypothetical protein
MKFQLLHRAVKGTPVVSLNTVTRAVHIRLLARQIHNTRILPAATATRLRLFLPTATLLFSSPTAPYMTTVMRTQLLVCGHTSSRPTYRRLTWIWRRLRPRRWVDRLRPRPTWIRPLRTSWEQLLHSRQRLVPQCPLSPQPPKCAIYSCQCGLIRKTCLDSLSLID